MIYLHCSCEMEMPDLFAVDNQQIFLKVDDDISPRKNKTEKVLPRWKISSLKDFLLKNFPVKLFSVLRYRPTFHSSHYHPLIMIEIFQTPQNFLLASKFHEFSRFSHLDAVVISRIRLILGTTKILWHCGKFHLRTK